MKSSCCAVYIPMDPRPAIQNSLPLQQIPATTTGTQEEDEGRVHHSQPTIPPRSPRQGTSLDSLNLLMPDSVPVFLNLWLCHRKNDEVCILYQHILTEWWNQASHCGNQGGYASSVLTSQRAGLYHVSATVCFAAPINTCHVARRFLSPQWSIIRYLARRDYNVIIHLQPICLIYKSKQPFKNSKSGFVRQPHSFVIYKSNCYV